MDYDVRTRLDQLAAEIARLRGQVSSSTITLPITEADVTSLVTDLAAKVPSTRTLTGTAPILIDGSNAARDLSADRTISIDSATVGTGTGIGGAWCYGDGSDGALVLAGHTTLAASQYVFNYTSITLAGFTLTGADDLTVIYCQGTLSLGGGTIQARQQAQVNGGASVQTGAGGGGGKGGGAVGVLFLYAKTISGTGTISASGLAGTAGTAGGTTSENTATAGGTNGSATSFLQGVATAGGNSTGGGVPTAGAASTALTAIQKTTFRNCLAWICTSGSYVDTTSQWYSLARSGAGGGAGEGQTIGGAGGGGGGGGGNYGNGGGGGAGGARGSGGGAGGGGGGGAGGGGAAGGYLIVATDSIASTVTCSANGGTGGAGAAGGAGTLAGDGGGGGGGGGGFVIVLAQASSGVTVTASLGAGGARGGTTATVGTAGGAGKAMSLVK